MKLGKIYITENNPRELLKEIAEKQNIIDRAIEKIKIIRILGLRCGKTLIATLLNEVLDILQGEEK